MAAISSGAGILFGSQVVEAEHEQRIAVRENPLVNQLLETRLVNPLKHGDGITGRLAGDALEIKRGAVEQLQTYRRSPARNASGPIESPRTWAKRRADLGHRREPVVHFRRVTVRFPRVAPGPVNAKASFARRVFSRDVILVVSARR